MITKIMQTVVGSDVTYKYVGKSSDTKPIAPNGSIFNELDTGKEYYFDGDEQGWVMPSDKYLDSIEIKTAPSKTTYYVGDKFSPSGLEVQANYTDESTAIVQFEIDAPEKLDFNSVVRAKYSENGYTRYANIEIEILSNKASTTEELVDILSNGSSVVLEDDISISNKLTLSNDFELDLNGFCIFSDATTTKKNDYFLSADGCELTIKGDGEIRTTKAKMRVANAINGGKITIESGHLVSNREVCVTAYGEGAKVTLNDGFVEGVEGGIMAFSGAEIEVNGGKIVVHDNFPIGTNGTEGQGGNIITVNGGYLEGNIVSQGFEAIGVYIANNDTFIMNDGEIKAINGAGFLMRGGNVTFNGGKITATGVEGGGGYIGDQTTVMSQSAIIYDEKSNYPGKKGMNLTINGGTFIGFDKSVDIQSNEEEPAVAINGGIFIPTLG